MQQVDNEIIPNPRKGKRAAMSLLAKMKEKEDNESTKSSVRMEKAHIRGVYVQKGKPVEPKKQIHVEVVRKASYSAGRSRK